MGLKKLLTQPRPRYKTLFGACGLVFIAYGVWIGVSDGVFSSPAPIVLALAGTLVCAVSAMLMEETCEKIAVALLAVSVITSFVALVHGAKE